MKSTKAILLLVASIISQSVGAVDVTSCAIKQKKADCFYVRGELLFWEGWPPRVRIATSNRKHVFGLDYDEDKLPPAIQALEQKHMTSGDNAFKGKFLICPSRGKGGEPPGFSTEMVCLRSMQLD